MRWETIGRFALMQITVAAAFPLGWTGNSEAFLGILVIGGTAMALWRSIQEPKA